MANLAGELPMRSFILLFCCIFIVSACSSKSGNAPSLEEGAGIPVAKIEVSKGHTNGNETASEAGQPSSGEESGSPAPTGEPQVYEDEDEAFLAEMDSEYGGAKAKVVADPLETFNRGMFVFNDKLYYWVLKPVATGWKAVVPSPARTGLRNFFKNLAAPIRIANNLLQGKFKSAGKETGKFLVNTIWGVGGFLQASEQIPVLRNVPDEDLGQTFGRWGIGNGFYLVLPFIGPTTLRDGIGKVGDGFLNPVYYTDWDWEAYVALYGVEAVNATSLRLGDYETIKEASLDPYTVVRDGYIRIREQEVKK